MSAKSHIICPKCQTVIELEAVFEKEMEEKLRIAKEEEKKNAYKWAMEEVTKKTTEAVSAKDKELAEKEKEIAAIKQEQVELKKQKEAAEKVELEARKRAQELEDRAKQMDLEVARKVDAEKKAMEEKMLQMQKESVAEQMLKMQEEYNKKLSEKDKQMEQLKASADELQRKALQGSQQIQGDIQEQSIKEALSRNFYTDTIEDVPTGIRGADIIQTVRDAMGRSAGVILWESKNTKSWWGDWISKLKNDAVAVKADMMIIVSNILPEGVHHLGCVDGVWVCDAQHFLPLTFMLRDKLLSLAKLSKNMEHKDEKMAVLYEYLSGNEFKMKFESIVRAFVQMKEDLDAEKRSMTKHWAKREKELERVIGGSTSLYGDLEWIMWRQLQTIEFLSLSDGKDESDIQESSL